MKIICILFISLSIFCSACAQRGDKPVIQFSGLVLSADSMAGLPFVHITIASSHQVATTRPDGYFSLAVAAGDTLLFSSIGFYSAYYAVSAGDSEAQVNIIQMMSRRDYTLHTVVVYPWGDKGNFKDEFLHTKVPKDMHAIAESNFKSAITNPHAPVLTDGSEATEHYMKALAQQYAYGKMQPNAPNIINPLAWAELIKAIKRGDFKKKAVVVPVVPEGDK